jgi:hypothetical protein
VASVALAGHGIWNRKSFTGNFVAQKTINTDVFGNLEIGPFFNPDTTLDQMWRPWKMEDSLWKQLGLNDKGRPINDQLWSTFQGRLGISESTSLHGASYLDGSGLNTVDWSTCSTVFTVGNILNQIPEDNLHADGPGGPGSRGWVKNAIPVSSR